jgi:hypothetical protein
MGSIIQITLIQASVLKSACTLTHLYHRQSLSWNSWLPLWVWQTMDLQHASRMNYGPTWICQSSEEGHSITWTQAGHPKQIVEISYAWIKISIADITVV